jgi:hypothetical protein
MAIFNAPLSLEVSLSQVVSREDVLGELFGRVGHGLYIEPPLIRGLRLQDQSR